MNVLKENWFFEIPCLYCVCACFVACYLGLFSAYHFILPLV